MNRPNSNEKSNQKHFAAKKLEYMVEAKTKYEQILSEHFQPKFSSKKSQILTVEDIRLSKICGKKSTILKLK